MSIGTKTIEEVPVYNNTKNRDVPFRFKYSEEDYTNHLPFLNDMTSLEEMKLNSFLNYIDETELKFKRPTEEIEDIMQAVSEVVDNFAKRLEDVDPLLTVSHKYAVGSMAEGTKIKEPDEFDFILVLKELTEDVASMETISEDDIYIECDSPDYHPCLYHYHVPRPDIQKCTGEISYQHVHLPLSSLAYSNRNKKFPGQWKRLGYISSWKRHFLQCLDRDSDCLLKVLNLKVTKNTGTIKNVKQNISEINNSGPAMKLALLWEPKSGCKLEISVDVVLAIERNGVENIIAMDKIPCQIYREILLETDQFFVVPIQAADTDVCFKATVTTTEHKIMSTLSKAHTLCYRILKYLFQGHSYTGDLELLTSYSLKTFLLRHTALCIHQDNPAQCLTNILKNLSIALQFCKLANNHEGIKVEHLFIPGLLINGSATYSFNDDKISKYLMANAEHLLEAAKSDYNNQRKTLEGLKDAWNRIHSDWEGFFAM